MPNALPRRTLGRTGLDVTQLGYGAMELRGAPRGPELNDEQAGAVLNAVLDAGINFIDTSPDYGRSEELIGMHLAGRRDEFILASKCGCPVGEAGTGARHIYTRENVIASVEQSLRRMKVDQLDLVQFHGGPSRAILEEHGAIEALRDLQQQGKVRFIGVSATLPNLPELIAMDVFDEFQIPYSALQREHEAVITAAAKAGAGTVIRGGVAKGAPADDKPWNLTRPDGVALTAEAAFTSGEIHERWERAGLEDLVQGIGKMPFMLRFTLTHPDLHTTIVGTSDPAHVFANVEAAKAGPLPADVYEEAKRRLAAAGSAPVA
ncbi:MAG: aldo/keto reductase [Dehalococcoidia bacterium]|nr:aldo/keto reductase [Dehalococcoidia bacterium]